MGTTRYRDPPWPHTKVYSLLLSFHRYERSNRSTPKIMLFFYFESDIPKIFLDFDTKIQYFIFRQYIFLYLCIHWRQCDVRNEHPKMEDIQVRINIMVFVKIMDYLSVFHVSIDVSYNMELKYKEVPS